MTSVEKLRFLLLRQFAYLGGTIAMLAVSLAFRPFGLVVALVIFLGLAQLMKRWEKRLREIDVRLTPVHKHIYFGVGLIYFLVIVGALLAWAILHPSPPAWFAAGLGFMVLFVGLYAALDSTYGRNAKI